MLPKSVVDRSEDLLLLLHYHLLLLFLHRSSKLFTQTDGKVAFHPKSVNYEVPFFSSQFLIYHTKVKSSSIFLHDATVIPPFPLLFFGGDISVGRDKEQETITVDKWIVFQAPQRIAHLVKVRSWANTHTQPYEILNCLRTMGINICIIMISRLIGARTMPGYVVLLSQELRRQLDATLQQKIAQPRMELYTPGSHAPSPSSQLIQAIIDLITTEDYSEQVRGHGFMGRS